MALFTDTDKNTIYKPLVCTYVRYPVPSYSSPTYYYSMALLMDAEFNNQSLHTL